MQAAIGGQAVTQVYEGEKHFDLTVRWAPAFRKDLQTIRNILVATPDGDQVPLGQLAQIVEEEGPSLDLSRGHAPLHAGEVLGARARSGVDDRRGAASGSPRR